MADPPTRPDGGGQKILGQPAWMWAVGAVVVVGGYLWFRNRASSGKSSGGGGQQKQSSSGGGGQHVTTTNRTFVRHITEWQSQPRRP